MRCVCPCACLCDCTFVMVWFLSMIICEYMWLGCLSVTMCSFLWLCVWLYMCDCGYQTVWLYDYVRPWVRFGYITLWFTWAFSGCVQFYVSESPSRWDCVGVWLYAWLCVTVCDHVCVCVTMSAHVTACHVLLLRLLRAVWPALCSFPSILIVIWKTFTVRKPTAHFIMIYFRQAETQFTRSDSS